MTERSSSSSITRAAPISYSNKNLNQNNREMRGGET